MSNAFYNVFFASTIDFVPFNQGSDNADHTVQLRVYNLNHFHSFVIHLIDNNKYLYTFYRHICPLMHQQDHLFP